MRYFANGWDENNVKAEKTIHEYHNYYKSIENDLPDNFKYVIRDRHDTHIVNTYFIENNYVMELEEHIWGKAKIIFCNATIKHCTHIKDDYWLYDEVYKVLDKIELHILFSSAEIVIMCDDAYINVEDKNYFKSLFEKEKYDNDVTDDTIATVVVDKESTCGFVELKPWEQLIFSFIQIYTHIKYYKYNNIEDKLVNTCYNLSYEERQNMYEYLLSTLERRLINSIEILQKYKEIIKDKELDNIINNFLTIYNKKNISMEKKNQLYLDFGKNISFDLAKTYKKILECIEANLIK